MLRALVITLTAVAFLPACSSGPPPREASSDLRPQTRDYTTSFEIERSMREDARVATITELLDRGFRIAAADRASDIIIAEPKPTAGLMTPWDLDQSSLFDELEDSANSQRRIIRVSILSTEPEPSPAPNAPAAPIDARDVQEDADPAQLTLNVTVIIERRNRPGRRLEVETSRRRGTWLDPKLIRRGMQPAYWVPVREDPALAARIAQSIAKRLVQSEIAASD